VNLDIHNILQQYWGYPSFRPLQEDIIRSVLDGHDTLALMPTGGGKSITFQISALAREGLCLVVTPLISLMKDQVDNLCKRDIKAIAIHSGMTRDEIDVSLNNCIFGGVNFFTSHLNDSAQKYQGEARKNESEPHCCWRSTLYIAVGIWLSSLVSKIAELREHLPEVTVLALTALLHQRCWRYYEPTPIKQHRLLSKSFERKNLAYLVRQSIDKPNYILKIIRHVQGAVLSMFEIVKRPGK